MLRHGFVVLAALTLTAVCAAQQPAPPPAPVAQMTVSDLLAEAERLVAAKQWTQARPYVEAVLAREQSNAQAISLRGEILEMTDQRDMARQEYLAVREIQPNDFRANLGLGRLYVESNMYRQALVYLNIAEPVAPPERKPELYVLLARAQRGVGNRNGAIEAVNRALEADAANFEAWQYAIAIMVESDEYDRAVAATQELVRIAQNEMIKDRSSHEGLVKLATAYDTRLGVLGSYHQRLYIRNVDGTFSDQLLPGMEKGAAAMLRDVVETMVLRAEVERTLGLYKILPIAEQAAKYDPSSAQTWMHLGLLYVNTSQYDKAAEALRRVLEIQPDNAQAAEQLRQLPRSGAPSAPPSTAPASAPASAPARQP